MSSRNPISDDQRGILIASAVAAVFCALVLTAGYFLLPVGLFGLQEAMPAGERIAFALKVDVLIFLWLAGCVKAVSGGRYRSPEDIQGSAFSAPSPRIAVKVAVLQNSLEQAVLTFGAHLALAAVLRGHELVLIPLLAFLFLVGRVAFALGYRKGARGRAFGMAVTGIAMISAYVLAVVMTVAGR